MDKKLTIVGVQMDVTYGDLPHNLEKMHEYLIKVAADKPFLVVFPECSLSGYCCQSLDEARSISIKRDDSLLEKATKMAKSLNLNWVFGFLEKENDQVFNSAALMTRSGQRHIYRKVHLPKLGVDQFTTAGCEFPLIDVEGVRIGINICYDCSFPEPSRVMALNGVDLIVLPTNWPPGADTTAEYIPNARALENHVYFMAVNRVGDERGFHFIGKSKICHPNGHSLAYANHDREEIIVAEFDPAVARNKHLIRVPGKHEIHRMADRRPETYTAITSRK